jgi:hypothetical protein
MFLFLKKLYANSPSQFVSSAVALRMMEAEVQMKSVWYEIYSVGFQRGYMAGTRDADNVCMRKVGLN